MLEILITMVIVATALFGTAGLQLNAMRMNQGGQFRTQAVFLAADIAERMEANKVDAALGNYVVASSVTASVAAVDCKNVVCTSAQLTRWDISQWEAAILGLASPQALPQASWQISRTQISTSPPINSSTYQIDIRWADRRADTTYAANNAASSVGISSDGKAELFSYTATRTISN